MELREIRCTKGWAFRVELHPRLTVVTGLGPARRAQLAAIVNAALLREVEGVSLIAETDEGPRPVSVHSLAEAGVPATLETRLRARDLPGALVTSSTRHGDHADRDRPESDAVLAARRRLDQARQAEKMLSEALDQVRDESPPTQATDRDRLLGRVDEARRAVESASSLVAESGGPAAIALREAAVAELTAERDELDAILDAPWEHPDTVPVAAAAAALRAALADSGEVSPSAVALADRWEALERRWVEVEEADRSRAADLARTSVELARVELARAEQYAKPLYVSAADRAELDAAHELVVQLAARASRKLGGRSAARRLEAARAVEHGILQRIGVTSYDAFLLRTSSILGDLDAADRLEQARRRMAEAEEAWERAQSQEPEPVRALRRERSILLSEAAAVLGRAVPAGEVAAALRSHRDAPDVQGLSAALAEALQAAGVVVRGEPLEEAEAWLARVHDAEQARRAAMTRRAAIDGDLAAATGALDASRAMGSARSTQAEEQLAAAKAALDVAEAELAAADEALAAAADHAGRVAEARHDLARSEREREDAEADLEDLLARSAEQGSDGDLPPAVVDEVDLRRVVLDDAEVYLLARIATLRDVGAVGGLPLVLDEPFAGLGEQATASMLRLLERVGSVIQVLCLTEDPEVIDWAGRLPSGATVARFAPA